MRGATAARANMTPATDISDSDEYDSDGHDRTGMDHGMTRMDVTPMNTDGARARARARPMHKAHGGGGVALRPQAAARNSRLLRPPATNAAAAAKAVVVAAATRLLRPQHPGRCGVPITSTAVAGCGPQHSNCGPQHSDCARNIIAAATSRPMRQPARAAPGITNTASHHGTGHRPGPGSTRPGPAVARPPPPPPLRDPPPPQPPQV
jgi:hypothetical protein